MYVNIRIRPRTSAVGMNKASMRDDVVALGRVHVGINVSMCWYAGSSAIIAIVPSYFFIGLYV